MVEVEDIFPSDPPASLPGPSGLDSTDDDVFNITVAQDDDDLVELEPTPAAAAGNQSCTIPLSTQQLESIAVASRLHRNNPDPDHEIPALPSLPARPPTRKRARDNSQDEEAPPPRRPTTRSQSTPLTEEEKREITKAAAVGVEGSCAISIHNMVNRKYRIPAFVKMDILSSGSRN